MYAVIGIVSAQGAGLTLTLPLDFGLRRYSMRSCYVLRGFVACLVGWLALRSLLVPPHWPAPVG